MPKAKPKKAPAAPISVSGSAQSTSSALHDACLRRRQIAGRKAGRQELVGRLEGCPWQFKIRDEARGANTSLLCTVMAVILGRQVLIATSERVEGKTYTDSDFSGLSQNSIKQEAFCNTMSCRKAEASRECW